MEVIKMSGTILGSDQITKVNNIYNQLHSHVKDVLTSTATPFEKMKAYLAVEYLNTTELARIFEQLPFISPAEKRALVRAAIDDVRLGTELPAIPVDAPVTDNAGVKNKGVLSPPTKFSPPPFKLNTITTESHQVV
jgi:hypothetical protein